MITCDDFKKVELKVGKILSAEKVADADKLLKLIVDFAETAPAIAPAPVQAPAAVSVPTVTTDVPAAPVATTPALVSTPRQIVSGIALQYPDPSVLVGKKCMFVTNLEPRTIRGLVSNGMILALSTDQGGFSLLEPNDTIPFGTSAK